MAQLRRSNTPPILPPGSASLRYIFRSTTNIPPPIPVTHSHRSLTSRPSTARSFIGSWSSTTAAVNESLEPFAQPFPSPRGPRQSQSSSTLRSQGLLAQWTFEYHDDESRHNSSAEDSLCEQRRESRINTQNVSRKFGLRAVSGLLAWPQDLEHDDISHDPRLSGIKLASPLSTRNKRGLANALGFLLIVVGGLMILVGLPVFSQVEQVEQYLTACEADPDCIRADLPLLQNVRRGLIDPDTPSAAQTRTDIRGDTLSLTFSDEFNQNRRTFYPGDDPYFQGEDFWYGVTQDLEWYDPDAISTFGGTLNIRMDRYRNHDLDFRSGMLQSWNKLCFKGGYVEANISLPGSGEVPGFWPGFWSSANLGRAGYAATTDGMWPYSYWNECDIGILPNQSSLNGMSWLPGMRLPACVCNGTDPTANPTSGRSRSAPELDILEGSVVYLGPHGTNPTAQGSQSLQAAPFDLDHLPNYDYILNFNSSITSPNAFKGSPWQESVSYITNLNSSWYDGNAYATFGMEYEPGPSGYVTFFIGGVPTWHIEAAALGPTTRGIGQRLIPVEPMTLITNLGMSATFADIDWESLIFPAIMRVDYIRIYQNRQNKTLGHWMGCDPPGYETTKYIANHPKAYLDWNVTTWEDAGYVRPPNSLRDGCPSLSR